MSTPGSDENNTHTDITDIAVEMESDAWTRDEEHRLEALQKKKDSDNLTDQEDSEYHSLYAKREVFYEAGLAALQNGKEDDSTKKLTMSDEFKVIATPNREKLFKCLAAMVVIGIAIIVASIVLADLTDSDPLFSQYLIKSPQGDVSGHTSPIEESIVRFLGIPYAQPPTGTHRWRSPRPASDWQGEFRASEFRVGCTDGTGIGTEDCLYLNVFVPRAVLIDVNKTALPVMYWIHGGCYTWGYGSDWGAGSKRYHADHLANTANAIVITAEYRLAAFGFIAHPLLRDPATNTTGNYGLEDQQQVLHWIQRNIESYGGDPTKVMLFGQSAGAGSISIHLVTPSSKGLFSSAALHSGSFANWIAQPMSAADTNLKALARSLNCSGTESDVIKCLRSKESWEVGQASQLRDIRCRDGCTWAPVVDGVFQADYPWASFSKGDIASIVPLLNVHTQDDGFDFVEHIPYTPSNHQWTTWSDMMFAHPDSPDPGAMVRTLYPPEEYIHRTDKLANEFFFAASAAETDFAYTCPARRTNIKISQLGGTVFSGIFISPRSDRSVHSSELAFLFGNRPGPVSNMLMLYWGNFARNHDPNIGVTVPRWSRYDESSPRTLFLGRHPHEVESYHVTECDYWDSAWEYFGQCVAQPGDEPSFCPTTEGGSCLSEFGVGNRTMTACIPSKHGQPWCATEVDAAGWPTEYNTCSPTCKRTDKQLKRPRLHPHAFGPTGVHRYLRQFHQHQSY